MFTETFNTPWTDQQHRVGQKFTVLGEKDKSTYDFEEVGVMYRIRFDDGEEIDAYPEEIVTQWVEHNKHAMLPPLPRRDDRTTVTVQEYEVLFHYDDIFDYRVTVYIEDATPLTATEILDEAVARLQSVNKDVSNFDYTIRTLQGPGYVEARCSHVPN